MEYGGGAKARSGSDALKQAPVHADALGLRVSPRLFGRLDETSALTDAYARVASSGLSEIVLISGSPGLGKSALVHRFQSLLRAGQHRFATGRCEQGGATLGPVLQALRSLIQAVLAQSDAVLDDLRDRLVQGLGNQVRLIADLLPEADGLVGQVPPLPDLPPALAQARVQRCLLAALAAFARRGQPLILFLDDLQWADPATQSVLAAFVGQPPADVLLVLAGRDEGLGDTLRQGAAPLCEIALAPLDPGATRALLAHALDTEEHAIAPLASAIHEQAHGNPFFIDHLLRRLREEQILTRATPDLPWIWDAPRLARMTGGGDVLDFLAGRLERLGADERAVMAGVAMLGRHGDAGLLASLLAMPQETVQRLARSLVESGLLTVDGASFAFPHDRVREAASLLALRDGRGGSHARAARLLLARRRRSAMAGPPFIIAAHILQSVGDREASTLKPGTQMLFAALLYEAAQQARSLASSEQAATCLDAAITLVSPQGWLARPALGFAMTHMWGETLLQRGRIAQADRVIEALLACDLPDRDRARACRLLAALRTVQSDYEGATTAALTGLALMGHPLKRSPSDEECRVESERVRALMGARPDDGVADLPLADDPDLALTTSLLSALLVCIFTGDGLRFLHLAKIVELTVTRGVTEDSAYGLAWYGVLISDFYGRYEDGFAYGQAALALIDKHGFEGQRTGALVAVDQLSPWTRSFGDALARVHDAIAAADAAGDLAMTCYARNHLVSNLIQMGRPLMQVEAEAEKGLEVTRRIAFRDIEILIDAQWHFARQLRNGPSPRDHSVITSASTRFLVLLYDGIAAYLFEDHRAAADAFALAEPLGWSMAAHIDLVYYTLFAALNAARFSPPAEALPVMERHRARLAQWAPLNPAMFGHKLLLVEAEMARIRGEQLEAMRLFDRAIAACGPFLHERALARELAGRHCDGQGLDGLACRYFDEAASDYRLWGAEAKARLMPRQTAAPQDRMAQDLLSAMRTIRRITREVEPDPMRQAVLRALMEHGDADRGQLLMMHEGDPVIEATGWREDGRVHTALETAMPTHSRVVPGPLDQAISSLAPVLTDVATRPGDPGLYTVLCLPLISDGRLVALAYLEAGAERSGHRGGALPVLDMLGRQGAICLERADWHAATFENYERRSQAESALREARAELAQSSHLATMGGMAASIAHEINQPLTSILANAAASMRWLRHAEPKVQEALLNLKGITTSARRAVEIITALRSLARQDVIQREALDLREVISSVLDLTGPDMETHQVAFRADMGAEPCMVAGDRVQLQQLILNLVKNGIEAMAGTVPEERLLHVSCNRVEGGWLTRIEDRGCGIAEEALAKIFTPLFTTKARGMGMGLAICSSIVAAHKGRLTAGAGQSGGTWFEFALPFG